MCLFVIHVSSLVKFLFESFASFVKLQLVFVLLSLECSLYVLDTRPLSDYYLRLFCPGMWLVFSFP